MLRFRCVAVLLALFANQAMALDAVEWSAVRNDHFEVYSQDGAARAFSMLQWFEQLRVFFLNNEFFGHDEGLAKRPAVRVVGFGSVNQYKAFRLEQTADAYYVSDNHRDYIVLPFYDPNQLRMAAHEYAHLVLRSRSLELPLWLSEGVAEYFSTVRLTERGYQLGGDLAARSDTLRRRAWLPMTDLLTLDAKTLRSWPRDQTAVFYAQSWALVDLLLSSNAYGPRFHELIATYGKGLSGGQTLAVMYGRKLEVISSDLHSWVDGKRSQAHSLPSLPSAALQPTFVNLSKFEADVVLADLFVVDRELPRAEKIYQRLLDVQPANPALLAALGTIALRQGDASRAREMWGKAVENGITDSQVCYDYAVLGDQQNLPAEDLRKALRRAVALRPDFDDARYSLALLESNSGEHELAIAQFRAMRAVLPKRAYAYWSAFSYSLNEAGHRDEAHQAAEKALTAAQTADERAHALQLRYAADTDLTVRLAEDGNGHTHLVPTRVARGTVDFNPFVQPSDRIVQTNGTLVAVRCSAGRLTAFDVDSQSGPLLLTVPDPLRVAMKNSPAEFSCGRQSPDEVRVQYAEGANSKQPGGILRGMEFLPRQQTGH